MTVPTPPAVSDAMREAVARIIDPVSFAYTPADFGFSGEDDPAWERSGGYSFRDPALKKADAILSGPIASEIARLTGERDAARVEGVLGWLKTYGKDTLADFTARVGAAEARAEAAEAETARLRTALEAADERAIARILAMSDEEVLSGVSPEKLAALKAERDAACARAIQGIVTRDCACCSDQPTIPPNCPACKGRGGFGPYPIRATLPSQEKPDA